jgi:hypothetical protein
MSKSNKPIRGINWTAIFERRPDLEPPGHHETIKQIKEEKPNDKDD